MCSRIETLIRISAAAPIQSGGPGGARGARPATDLDSHFILIGGTNGAHLTSFSLIGMLSHGRACGLLNPLHTVFFAPEVEVHSVARVVKDAGYGDGSIKCLSSRALGKPSRALTAFKDPQLKMQLENMVVPPTAEMANNNMRTVLRTAKAGDQCGIPDVA